MGHKIGTENWDGKLGRTIGTEIWTETEIGTFFWDGNWNGNLWTENCGVFTAARSTIRYEKQILR